MLKTAVGAFKKMSQRLMLRGKNNDASAIGDQGMVGMRSVLLGQTENKSTPANIVSDVQKREMTDTAKNSFNAQGQNTSKKLGGSIVDALK